MGEGEVYRQHETTEVTEVLGCLCEEFLEVRCLDDRRSQYFYLKLSGVYHRFLLHVGILRWQSHRPPDPEHDLELECCYVNLGRDLEVLGAAVERAHMEDERFELRFSNGVKLEIRNHFTQEDDWMEVRVSGGTES